ncbi:tRNA pseudouridine(38-40) synthase TruA [Microbacteriaceae bacterium 4G12]
MERIKCTMSYDGTHFSGYQIQQNKRTVQQEIEDVLQKLHKGEHIRVQASGRTDAGVHARGQVIHFDSMLDLSEDRWMIALNTLLPDDIAIGQVEKVSSDFHCRYSVTSKEYRYHVVLSRNKDVFRRNYAYHYPYKVDIDAIRAAIPYFLGTHDFTSFCSARTKTQNRVRTLYEIDLRIEGNELIFRFIGSGFLYNMVRILVGTLLTVGQGRIQAEAIPDVLALRSPRLRVKTAPGHGLYLWEVNYNN